MATSDFLVYNENGDRVYVGDEITDFRGDVSYFAGVTRGTEYNGTAKVLAKQNPDDSNYSSREYYDRVFDLKVVRKSGAIKWMDSGTFTWFDDDGTPIVTGVTRDQADKIRDDVLGY